jgi:endonuclease/exonuclease/phosphatase family metal-dependent hydrolase
VVGPSLLLAGMFAVSPAALATGYSYLEGGPDFEVARGGPSWVHLMLLGWAATMLVIFAMHPPRHAVQRWLGVLGLLVASVIFGYGPPVALGPAVLIAAPSLGLCIGMAADRRWLPRRSQDVVAVAGMLVFGIGVFAYYAAYDVGYPNGWVPVVMSVVVGAAAVFPWPLNEQPDDHQETWIDGRRNISFALAAVLSCALVAVGWSTPPPLHPRDNAHSIRLVTYNIRMGFGLSGTFDPAAAAAAIAGQRPDIVTLSEVDRGWLLNGGHDTVDTLARRLGMRYIFAPAADHLWGDAVLTDLPVTRTATMPLTADGAPTGAQALGVVVRVGGRELAVVATHIQPPPGRPPLVQAREIANFATAFGGARLTFVAGDLNIEPESAAMRVLTGAGYADALAAQRPVYTFPADRPVQQIDHVLVRGGLSGADVVVPRTAASDHAPVAVTLTW